MKGLKGIKGLGPKRLEALNQAGIFDLPGLLDCLPMNYLFAQETQPIARAKSGMVCVMGRVEEDAVAQYYGGRSTVRVKIRDESGLIKAIWFNQPWMAKMLRKGHRVCLYGQISQRRGFFGLLNPKILHERGILPQYRPLPGLPGKVFGGFVSQALEGLLNEDVETLPASFRAKHALTGRLEAWRYAHQPRSREEIEKAQRRFAFENLLLYQLAVRLAGPGGQVGPQMTGTFVPDAFWQELPFSPTKAQQSTLAEVVRDMNSPVAMRRLVQGDVGSGKTAVAFGAALRAICAGYQCALMAPTELLARQHFTGAQKLLAPFHINCGLLTGSLGAVQRREALACIEDGSWQLVIGTHALISKGVEYHQLGLVITDEQHRFGVRQRQSLAERATGYTPHILALSATPIPRSLALVLYGDLKVSVMDELPPGRTPVKTRIVPEGKRSELYAYIHKKALEGEQSYLVCPLVEDSDEGDSERTSAISLFERLKTGPLKGVTLSLTFGSQDETEKTAALEAFYSGEAAVMVSTTVIEVGMDVPNATTMVIEDAEQFGLAQLHQLRGRVGRGQKESWCFLLGEANERLNTLVSTNDGFEIARKDLELRGPGEFLGTRQHGKMLNTYGMHDMRLVEETANCLADLEEDVSQEGIYLHLKKLAEERYGEKLMQSGIH